MTPDQDTGQVFNDLTPQEIETLGTVASAFQSHPEVVKNLDLPGNIDYDMLQKVWGKIATGSQAYASGSRSGRSS